MKLFEYIDPVRLQELLTAKLVSKRKHPVHNLFILNYTHAAQGEKNWGDTLSKCRGIVYEDGTDDIYAIPFKKFWNYLDFAHPETLPENLPDDWPKVFPKTDGSLGVGFWYKNEFIIATRGSFESDQAKWAQEWVNQRVQSIPMWIDRKPTFLFEIVMPGDRKVVNYDFSGLVYLGIIYQRWIHPEKGIIEGDYPPCKSHVSWLRDVKITKEIVYNHFDELHARDIPNEEGYVAVWYNRFNTRRVKIKFPTYTRLHRMFFQTSTDVIWELLKTGKFAPYVQEIEDLGLRSWVQQRGTFMALDKVDLEEASKREYRQCLRDSGLSILEDPAGLGQNRLRKEFAAEATKANNPDLLFLLLDNKYSEYEERLWKKIKPKNEFYRKEEE